MPIPTENEVDLVIRNSEEAIGALVDAVVGQKVPQWHYDEDWLYNALGLTKTSIARSASSFAPSSLSLPPTWTCLTGRTTAPSIKQPGI